LCRGAYAVDRLQDGDEVLIAESCTHHVQPEDIGRSKIPTWLLNHTGKKLIFDVTAGGDYPADLKRYALIVQCGGCMMNRREVMSRVEKANAQGVPVTNYGVLIAHLNGILGRIIDPFAGGVVKIQPAKAAAGERRIGYLYEEDKKMSNKVLIIDDDVDFVEAMSSLLDAKGYAVSCAYDGEAGYAKARSESPDIILLDVMMRQRAEGFDIARKLHEDPALGSTPVVLITGIRNDLNLPFGFEPNEEWLNVKAVLEKPIKSETLLKTIGEHIKK